MEQLVAWHNEIFNNWYPLIGFITALIVVVGSVLIDEWDDHPWLMILFASIAGLLSFVIAPAIVVLGLPILVLYWIGKTTQNLKDRFHRWRRQRVTKRPMY